MDWDRLNWIVFGTSLYLYWDRFWLRVVACLKLSLVFAMFEKNATILPILLNKLSFCSNKVSLYTNPQLHRVGLLPYSEA